MPNRTRLLRLSAAVALAAALLYSALWYWEASVAEDRIARVIEHGKTSGFVIASGATALGGYPFRIEVRMTDVTLGGLPRLPDVTAAAPSVTFRFHPLSPADWSVRMPDGITVKLPTSAGPLHVAAHESALDLGLLATSGDRFAVRAGDVTLGNSAGAIHLESIDLRSELPPPSAEAANRQLGFSVLLSGLTLPRKLGPLGAVIDEIAFDGSIQGDLPSERLGDALAAWRDGGGTVELRDAHIVWGRLKLDAEGTVSLDRDMQPEAAFSAEVHNLAALFDAMVADGSMKPGDAEFAKLGLALIGGGSVDGDTALKTPITVQGSQLYVEKKRVAHVPHIEWP